MNMIQELISVIEEYSLNSKTPGLAFLLKKSNETIYESYIGYRNSAHEPINQKSKFRTASISKQFTAVAILQLIEENKLRLDTPLNTILEDLGSYVDSVTIEHLLTHTSGLPDYEKLAVVPNDLPFTDTDVYETLSKVSILDFVPGTRYHYSNTAYCLLAVVVQKLSTIPYREYLEKRVFPKADMHQASVGPTSDDSRVYGFAKFDADWTLHDQSGFTATQGDGGIYASANDLMNWQHSLYAAKTIITPKSLELMTKQYVQTQYADEYYGLGIAITAINKELCYLHHGTSSGFENALFYLPKFDISLAILANFSGTDFDTIKLGKRILRNQL